MSRQEIEAKLTRFEAALAKTTDPKERATMEGVINKLKADLEKAEPEPVPKPEKTEPKVKKAKKENVKKEPKADFKPSDLTKSRSALIPLKKSTKYHIIDKEVGEDTTTDLEGLIKHARLREGYAEDATDSPINDEDSAMDTLAIAGASVTIIGDKKSPAPKKEKKKSAKAKKEPKPKKEKARKEPKQKKEPKVKEPKPKKEEKVVKISKVIPDDEKEKVKDILEDEHYSVVIKEVSGKKVTVKVKNPDRVVAKNKVDSAFTTISKKVVDSEDERKKYADDIKALDQMKKLMSDLIQNIYKAFNSHKTDELKTLLKKLRNINN